MKQKFKLTPEELLAILGAFESKTKPDSLWQSVCKRVGCDYASLEPAKTNDPHEFLAEPLAAAPAVAVEDVRKGATSASNAAYDRACPGRHQAQIGIPEPERSEDALSGSRIHEALADSGKVMVMQKLSLSERDMFDSCRDIEKKLVGEFFGLEPKGYRVFRQERLWVPDSAKIGFPHSGEPDVVFRAGTKALIADYKVLTGDIPEASRNEQLRDLAVLVMGAYPPLTEIGTVIIQPLVTHSPEICLYKEDDLVRAFIEMRDRVRASNAKDAPRVAGEAQCKFCRARTSCKEFNKWQGSLVPVITDASKELFSVAMKSWSPLQMAYAAEILPTATKRLEEIKDFLKAAIRADAGSIPGWGLSEGAKREVITNPQGVFERFAALGGKLEQFLGCIKVEKGKLEEAVHEVADVKGKALRTTMAQLLEGHVETKTNQPSLERIPTP